MKKILFVNACVRGEQSRTLNIARRFLEEYKKQNPEVHTSWICMIWS